MKNPFMTRKEHERIVSALCLSQNKKRNDLKKTYEDTVYKTRKGLRRILDKFSKVSVSCFHDDYTTWRAVFDFNPRPIIFALERGDDVFMIEQIAEELKYKLIKELCSLNIQHPDNLGLER